MYKVDDNYKDCKVYTNGKTFLLSDATQKDLKSLFVRGHPGIIFKEKRTATTEKKPVD